MVRDTFRVIKEGTSVEFETALNQGGVDGFKIVPLTVTIAPGSYQAVMGKTEDTERSETAARAKAAGLHTLENYGV